MNKSTFDIKRFFTQSYYTVEPLYSGQILLKLGESRSNSYKKPLYSGQFIADTRYNGHVFPDCGAKSTSIADSSEICLKQ